MKELISKNLNEALCEQIGQEKFNASVYLFISGYLKNKGLTNLAKHFDDQHEEEVGHSKMIADFLTDLDSPIMIPEINSPKFGFNTIKDVAEAYLTREIDTTESLDSIKHLAIDENNPVAEEFIRDMIKIQRSEYSEACDFMDKAELSENDWKFVLLWDASLGKG